MGTLVSFQTRKKGERLRRRRHHHHICGRTLLRNPTRCRDTPRHCLANDRLALRLLDNPGLHSRPPPPPPAWNRGRRTGDRPRAGPRRLPALLHLDGLLRNHAYQRTTGGGGESRNRGSVDRAERRPFAILEISALFLQKLALSAGSR